MEGTFMCFFYCCQHRKHTCKLQKLWDLNGIGVESNDSAENNNHKDSSH